jgi:hypothetical protein
MDGEQFGPFTLPQAQDWVIDRPAADELFCWSEGFDDWLPVEKVSHFRGLRSPDANDETVVDAPPESGAPAALNLPAPVHEDTPVPLFAATMARIAAEAPTEINEEVRDRFPDILAPRNGVGAGAGAGARGANPLDRAAHAPLVGSAGRVPVKRATLPPPHRAAPPVPARPAAPAPALEYRGGQLLNEPSTESSGLDLEIGEASRVVKLPMLARHLGSAGPAGDPGLPGMGGSPLGLGTSRFDPVGSAGGTGLVGGLPVIQAGGTIDMPRPELLQPRAPRNLVLPVVLAGAALLGAVVVLLYVAMSGEEEEDPLARGQIGAADLAYQFEDLDKDGKDDRTGKSESEVVAETVQAAKSSRRGGTGGRSSSGAARSVTSGVTSTDEVDLSGSDRLRELDPSDLISAYTKNRTGVTMCYNHALKRDPLLRVQKAVVTIKVEVSGSVSRVSVPSLRGTDLGTCLETRIRAWRFPKSTSGLSSEFPIIFDS